MLAAALLSSRAGFVWFLQQFFFLMSLFLLFSPNVFITCLLLRLFHARQLSGEGGLGQAGVLTLKLFFAHPSNHQKEAGSLPWSPFQPCPDKDKVSQH